MKINLVNNNNTHRKTDGMDFFYAILMYILWDQFYVYSCYVLGGVLCLSCDDDMHYITTTTTTALFPKPVMWPVRVSFGKGRKRKTVFIRNQYARSAICNISLFVLLGYRRSFAEQKNISLSCNNCIILVCFFSLSIDCRYKKRGKYKCLLWDIIIMKIKTRVWKWYEWVLNVVI